MLHDEYYRRLTLGGRTAIIPLSYLAPMRPLTAVVSSSHLAVYLLRFLCLLTLLLFLPSFLHRSLVS
jgi:hypothetical protein